MTFYVSLVIKKHSLATRVTWKSITMKSFNKLIYRMKDYRRKHLQRKCYDSRESTRGTLMVLRGHIEDNR
jgi:hypothetical protein